DDGFTNNEENSHFICRALDGLVRLSGFTVRCGAQVTFSGNTSGAGCRIRLVSPDAEAVIDSCIFEYNLAPVNGGALIVWANTFDAQPGHRVIVRDCQFRFNLAGWDSFGNFGAGAVLVSNIRDTRFEPCD